MSNPVVVSSTASTIATDNPGLGSLGFLPREIRDEIYRYLVKGIYYLWNPRKPNIRSWRPLIKSDPEALDPTILQVSKAINKEALVVQCSEGTLHCLSDIYVKDVDIPQVSIDRMMNIELEVSAETIASLYGLMAIDSRPTRKWKNMIRKLSASNLIRKTIRIIYPARISPLAQEEGRKLLRDLGALTRFHTVIVEVYSVFCYADGIKVRRADGLRDEDIDSAAKATMKDLESVLGPATFSRAKTPFGLPDYLRHAACLRFHPHEHLAGSSGVEAKA